MWLCKTCHTWAHAHPFEARGLGLIVTRYSAFPGEHPATTHFGEVLLNCEGMFTYYIEEEEQEQEQP